MGLKLTYITNKNIRRVSVGYDSLQYKIRSKTFKLTQLKEALDFALAQDSRYIDSCDPEILDYAHTISHAILVKKNWTFV
jgi:hypothetical protein